MPFSGPGAGTENDKFLVSTPQHVLDIPAFDTGQYYQLQNEVDMGGAEIPRMNPFIGNIDFNGFGIINIGGLQFGSLFKDYQGVIRNGYMHFNVSQTGGCQIFSETEDSVGAGVYNVRFYGSIESTNDEAQFCGIAREMDFFDVTVDVDFTGNTGEVCVIARTPNGVDLKRFFYTGTLASTGTATISLYGSLFTPAWQMSQAHIYYDVTKNPSLLDLEDVTARTAPVKQARTTAELQSIAMYQDKTDRMYGREINNWLASTTSGSKTFTMSAGSLSSLTIGEEYRIGYGANAQVFILESIVSSTEGTAVDPFSLTRTDDTFARLNADEVISIAEKANYVDEDWMVEDGVAYPIHSWQVVPIVFPSGTATLSDGTTPADSANICTFTVPNLISGTPVAVDADVIADVNGDWEAVTEPNRSNRTFALVRHAETLVSGNVTGVSGTGNVTLSTDMDLSPYSIGGADDFEYAIKGISGSGAGDISEIKSRASNDAELYYNPAFDATSVVEFVRISYGISKVLPKSEA